MARRLVPDDLWAAIKPCCRPHGGDKSRDHRFRRADCRRRGIAPRIARRGIESGARPGRHRWKVERALARLNRFRRLAVRYERRADIHLAFAALGCALVCLNQIRRSCYTSGPDR